MWIVPTLSRPKQCAEVLRRICEIGYTSKGILVNNGDYHDWWMSGVIPQDWGIYCPEKNLGALGALNNIFKKYPNEPFYGFIADDEFLMPDSPSDWDQRLIAAAGKWDIAHGLDDMHQGKRMQGYVCIGGDLARAVGYLALPTCWHWYGLDNMWEWLSAPTQFGGGGAFQMKLVPEIKVEHRHFYVGKAPMDNCYALGESKSEEDRLAFIKWQQEEMPAIAERIKVMRAKNV